jgi:hypothetical protein
MERNGERNSDFLYIVPKFYYALEVGGGGGAIHSNRLLEFVTKMCSNIQKVAS